MNILIIATHINTGGITSYIVTLTKELMRQGGHSVLVVTSGGDRAGEIDSCGAKHITFDIKTKSELSPKIYRALPRLRRLIKEKNIDVIHAHTRVTQVLACLAARSAGIPYVTTCHGFFKPRLSRRLFPCWGNQVIAISEPVKDHLLCDFKVNPRNIMLIHNGIDMHEFSVDSRAREQIRGQFKFGNVKIIGAIGRLSDVKGYDILISAMTKVVAQFPDALLCIVGQGKMERWLKELTRDLNLGDHVAFYPIMNKTAGILPAFDIFVMPSLQEGLGLSVLEAQASGLAVVASRVGGLPTLIDHGTTGLLVEPKDRDGLADAVCRLLLDPAQARAMGEKARSFVADNFSAGQMAVKTAAVYRSVIKDKR